MAGRVREERRKKYQRRERARRKKMQAHKKVEKSGGCVFSSLLWLSGGSKSRLAKAAGAKPSGQMRDEKWHTIVERSRFGSQKTKSTSRPDHSSEVEMSKKCTPETHVQVEMYKSHHASEIEMLKKCTLSWREVHFEVISVKDWRCRSTFWGSDVEKMDRIVARSTFRRQKF